MGEPSRRASTRQALVTLAFVAALIAAFGGVEWSLLSFPSTPGAGTTPPAGVQDAGIRLPYQARMKAPARLLPCCNVAVALTFLNASPEGQQRMLSAGYFSSVPSVGQGAAVLVRAVYALRGDTVGQQILLYPSVDRLTAGTAALVETQGGSTGYVPALLVLPP